MAIGACLVLALLPLAAKSHWNWHGPILRLQELGGLSFGTIAPDLHAPGIVRIRPNRDGNSRCGHPLVCLEGGTRGRFRLSSTRTRYVHFAVPDEAVLTSNTGDTMRVSRFRLHGRNVFRGCGFVRRNHPEIIGVGASLEVGAGQPPGHYRGTYEITVTYE